MEIADSVAMMAGHQVAFSRGYHGRLQAAVQAFENDVLSNLLGYHEMTAVLDKVAAGGLLARRQDMAGNPPPSPAPEQPLAPGQPQRGNQASAIHKAIPS